LSAVSGRIAFFDFDGTLTRRDTFWGFHVHCFGLGGALSASVRAAASSAVSARFGRQFMKERFISALWAGTPHEAYIERARGYALSEIDKNLLPHAVKVFKRHLELGDAVYIVTASIRDWVAFWAERYGVSVIGTELEVERGILTGRMSTPNCRGMEKVARIREAVDLGAYSRVFAYGNSGGDREMLGIADDAVYNWDHIPNL
jgi:HAD superfamily hydrolase (TIGR01490 family)